MRAGNTQVRGVPPAIVAPVGGANPGDGRNSPSLSYDPAPAFPVPPNRAGSNRGRWSAPPPPPNFWVEHDPEEWDPVFGQGSCSGKKSVAHDSRQFARL